MKSEPKKLVLQIRDNKGNYVELKGLRREEYTMETIIGVERLIKDMEKAPPGSDVHIPWKLFETLIKTIKIQREDISKILFSPEIFSGSVRADALYEHLCDRHDEVNSLADEVMDAKTKANSKPRTT